MKLSDGFDARRLRPSRGSGNWRLRIATLLAALFALFGLLLATAAAATLMGHPPALDSFDHSPGTAGVLLALGLLLLWAGVLLWRFCRRRLRRTSDLSLAPHLMKKRD